VYLSSIETMQHKPIANILLNGEKLKAFVLKAGMRQGCTLLLIVLNMLLKVLTRAIRKEKET
jgi:hypothetical protein